jgi:acyl-CoA reductase-like NAD-dependent aldehyde dehydrogenase
MELGGKCPVIIDKSADLDYAAYKTMFGKFQNSGQTCIGVDYILVHESLLDKTVDSLLFHLHKQYGISKNDPKSFGFNDLVGKLINE